MVVSYTLTDIYVNIFFIWKEMRLLPQIKAYFLPTRNA